MALNFTYDNPTTKLLKDIELMFEAEEEINDEQPSNDENTEVDNPNIEIAPPPEDAEIKNSDFFIDGKVSNSYITNDPAIHNIIQIISADMEDQDKLKGYVEVLFTRLGINDVDSDKFKIFSGEIWNKLEELTEVDPKTSLAEFSTWAQQKISQYNR